MHMATLQALRLISDYRHRVWGGQRLKPSAEPYGEAWLVYEENRVAAGPHAGKTLAEVAAQHGAALLGTRAAEGTGARFPLLIKLLDCADWLSVQVHPNDEQARRLEGPDEFGKTEAWHILESEPGAELICGLRPGTTAEMLQQAIKEGTVVDLGQRLRVDAGDTVFVQAGMIHALGPGLLLYEVQQTSDTTYRVFDWNRPSSAGRELHIEQSLAVADPMAVGEAKPLPPLDGGRALLVECPYFRLERLEVDDAPLQLDTGGASFHALTVIEGQARVRGDGWTEDLGRFETVVVPAAAGSYTVESQAKCGVLKASVE